MNRHGRTALNPSRQKCRMLPPDLSELWRLMWNKYDNYRTVITFARWCNCGSRFVGVRTRNVIGFIKPIDRAKSRWALPQHEFGLSVIARVGVCVIKKHQVYQRFMNFCNNELSIMRTVCHSRFTGILHQQQRSDSGD